MKTTTFLFLILVLSACSIPRTKSEESTLCNDSTKFRALIAATINQEDFQHARNVQKLIGQEDLIILKNDQRFDKLGNLHINGCAVRTLSEREIKEQNIKAYLDYMKIQIIGDSAYVHFHYDIKGFGMEGFYHFESDHWEADSVDVFDY